MKSRRYKKKAVVLLSGGLDSATVLYCARAEGYDCYCLIFDYGQRHRREISSAKRLASGAGCPFKIVRISLPWKGSSLLDSELPIQKKPSGSGGFGRGKIPLTYVPARNIIFLSFALSYAETIRAKTIFIGAHACDYSGYPDCRPEFYRAFEKVIMTGTKAGVEGEGIKIETPLIKKDKASIIRLGNEKRVPFELTWSCYRGGRVPCGECESCYFRAKGFKEAGLPDPGV